MFYVVRTLSPYTEYEFYVFAVNNIGRGPASVPATCTTGETGKFIIHVCLYWVNSDGVRFAYAKNNFFRHHSIIELMWPNAWTHLLVPANPGNRDFPQLLYGQTRSPPFYCGNKT